MAWGKVDDNMAFHPKVVQAGNEAMGLWVRALSWSMSILSDGHVPAEMVTAFNGDKSAQKLVDAGLWIIVDGGFQFRDWAEYQPTKEQILSDRASAKERMTRIRGRKSTVIHTNFGDSSDDVRANMSRTNSERSGDVREKFNDPDPTRPKGSKEPLNGAKRAQRIPDNFSITDEMSEWAKSTVPGLDIRSHTAMFNDYWQSASGSNARKMDWVRAWQVWMRREFMKMPVSQRTVNHTALASDASRYCTHGWPKGECDRCENG